MKLPWTVLLLLSSLLAWGDATKSPTPRLKVAVDAGHGGEDTGALGPKGLKEKDAALAMALELKPALEQAGFEVLLIRSDDTLVPLWDRAKLANAKGADLFVSLHLNAARARAAKGSEVYFLSLGQAEGEAKEVAALENAGAGGPKNPDTVIASILEDLAQKAFLQDSERLAVAIQTQLNRLGGIKERGVKQAPFVVLRSAAMPAVLVEVAFISNPKEELKLKDPAFRRKAALAIAHGIRRFFASGSGTTKRGAVDGG